MVGDKKRSCCREGVFAGDKSVHAGVLSTDTLGHLGSFVHAACACAGGVYSLPPGSSCISDHIGSLGQVSRDTLELEVRYGHGLGEKDKYMLSSGYNGLLRVVVGYMGNSEAFMNKWIDIYEREK